MISSLSHEMDYGSLISIDMAEKRLANDPNLDREPLEEMRVLTEKKNVNWRR